ncbi:uncharacterized protein LOC131623425 [Vicia villosa]|uniref:uncharacterized protein LOC131623425 n=1 Tax=Vicia villosa TaxID=3911 RepID=UPI00273BEFA6|nr:uncharacterized protein LOC131623425 [Vicia villosa]
MLEGKSHGGGWQEVRKKSFKQWVARWDVFPWGGGDLKRLKGGVITSIYFSEFPDPSSAKDFFELFGCIGSVFEVSISSRKNKWGKKFGFAKFVDVEDERMVAIRCDNVCISGRKILANIPRFERRKIAETVRFAGNFVRKHGGVIRREGEQKVMDGNVKAVSKNRSFAEVLLNANQKGERREEVNHLLSYTFAEGDKVRISKAYVGVATFPGSTRIIQTHFEMEGYFDVKVTPMGGNLCLLEEVDEGAIQDLIEGGEAWWKQWFREIRRWKDTDVDEGRLIWIRVFGVPKHAWNSEFFCQTSRFFGIFRVSW